MVYVNKDSNTRTGTGHELEAIDLTNDHEEGFEICADVRASGKLVPHHGSLTFTNLFPLENTGLGFSTTYETWHRPYKLSPRLKTGPGSRRAIRSRPLTAATAFIRVSAWRPLGPRPQEPLPLHDEWIHRC